LVTALYGSKKNWGEYTAQLEHSLNKLEQDRLLAKQYEQEAAHTYGLGG